MKQGFARWMVKVQLETGAVAQRLRRLRDDERGQTQTEYLMIVGLMAAVIIAVFVTLFWPQVKSATTALVERITKSIGGGDIN